MKMGLRIGLITSVIVALVICWFTFGQRLFLIHQAKSYMTTEWIDSASFRNIFVVKNLVCGEIKVTNELDTDDAYKSFYYLKDYHIGEIDYRSLSEKREDVGKEQSSRSLADWCAIHTFKRN